MRFTCYAEEVEKIIFTPPSGKIHKRQMMEVALETFYGKMEIPLEKVNWLEKRASNGGLMEKSFN